ncbi:hypothetical protein BKA66DRAFT_501680 [Pyrenochaeta sp. MPI-SDFR-AT-0127]|nr:hypothetical protein BKA66DRAFT_501680 [Pyrenochaeta sp. MPI-SDFR-AT-0127]
MAFSTLPPELKLNIAEQLDPASSLNFALTSRDHAKLCRSTLRNHARLFAEWQVIDTAHGGVHAGRSEATLLWSTLKEVLEDPRKGWYVRELNLPSSRRYHWDISNLGILPPDLLAAPPKEDQHIFKKAAQALGGLYPISAAEIDDDDRYRFDEIQHPSDFIATLEDRITAGYDDAIIAILVHHLPYLKTIRFTDSETDCFELMMRRVASGYKDPAIAARLPFQHLTTAAVAHYDSEMCCNADWACFFLCVPSMQTFVAEAMGERTLFGNRQGFLPDAAVPISNVTEMFFDRCQFDVEALHVILAGVKHLKRFTYHGGGPIVSESAWYEPKKVIAAIAAHVGHSLEELVLGQGDDADYLDAEDDLESVSLCEFKKLTSFHAEWKMIWPQHQEPCDDEPLKEGFYAESHSSASDFDIRTILPESLEELYLHGVFDDDEWEQLTIPLGCLNSTTPKLHKMCIRRHGRNWPYEPIETFGDAAMPPPSYYHQLAKLLEGHGY